MVWHGFEDLAPHGWEGATEEPFDDWWRRAQAAIPHVPKCVAEQWLHRHWGHSLYESLLPLERMRFELQTWPLEALERVELHDDWGANPSDLERLNHPDIRDTPLAQLMIKAGTWPVPIIALDNVDGLKDRHGPMGRWRLLEGHTRLTYVRSLVHKAKFAHKAQVKPSHDVWVTTVQ